MRRRRELKGKARNDACDGCCDERNDEDLSNVNILANEKWVDRRTERNKGVDR